MGGKKKDGGGDDDAPEPSLKWQPGAGGAAAKARAKELRKEIERRNEKKEHRRIEKKELAPSASAAATPRRSGAPATDAPPRPASAAATTAACTRSDVCKFFLAGTCNKGDKCKFLHVVPEQQAASAAVDGGDGGGDEPKLGGYDQLDANSWHEVLRRLDGRGLISAACACSELAEAAADESLWDGLHSELFFDGGEPEEDDYATAAGYTKRERVVQSEAQLQLWRLAATSHRPPLPLSLPEMTAVALCGGGTSLGVSAHANRLVRLWDCNSGRRLASHEHRRPLTACAACAGGHGVVAVGDAGGWVSLYGTGSDAFAPDVVLAPRQPELPHFGGASASAVVSIALLGAWDGAATLVVASSANGAVEAALAPPPATLHMQEAAAAGGMMAELQRTRLAMPEVS